MTDVRKMDIIYSSASNTASRSGLKTVKPNQSDLSDPTTKEPRPGQRHPTKILSCSLLGRYEEKGDDAHDSKEEHMNKKLYVGGLAFSVTDSQLQQLFTSQGTVESAKVITDRDSDRSRGFGFVEMSTQEEAEKAIAALNGTQFEGRALTVNISKPREDRPSGGGYRR